MENFDRLYAMEFRPEAADIRVGGVSHFLTPRSFHCLLYREMSNSLGRGAEAILFRAGHERGRKFYLTTAAALFSDDLGDVVEAAKFLASHLGLYRVRSFSSNPTEGEAQLMVDGNFEVCPRHMSSRPQCHLSRGFWAGLLEEAWGGGRSITGEEKECQGMGYAVCRLEFFPAKIPEAILVRSDTRERPLTSAGSGDLQEEIILGSTGQGDQRNLMEPQPTALGAERCPPSARPIPSFPRAGGSRC